MGESRRLDEVYAADKKVWAIAVFLRVMGFTAYVQSGDEKLLEVEEYDTAEQAVADVARRFIEGDRGYYEDPEAKEPTGDA
jgi:hypothetical protein